MMMIRTGNSQSRNNNNRFVPNNDK